MVQGIGVQKRVPLKMFCLTAGDQFYLFYLNICSSLKIMIHMITAATAVATPTQKNDTSAD